METKDWINVAAILLSPVIAVLVTLWYQSRKEKRDIKLDIFFTLMENRASLSISDEFVKAINSIDFVFDGDNDIKQGWTAYYNSLSSKNPDPAIQGHLYIDLLSAIATHLGYRSLRQTEIDRYYIPQSHGNDAERQREVSDELLRLLKASEHYGAPRVVVADEKIKR